VVIAQSEALNGKSMFVSWPVAEQSVWWLDYRLDDRGIVQFPPGQDNSVFSTTFTMA
jgi:hypothetical protein